MAKMKPAEPESMSTDALVNEHDRLVRDIRTYITDARHERLEAVAESIAERASYGDLQAQRYGIYL